MALKKAPKTGIQEQEKKILKTKIKKQIHPTAKKTLAKLPKPKKPSAKTLKFNKKLEDMLKKLRDMFKEFHEETKYEENYEEEEGGEEEEEESIQP